MPAWLTLSIENVLRVLDQPCPVDGLPSRRPRLKIAAHQLQRLAVVPGAQPRNAIGRDNQLEIAYVSLRCRDEDAGFRRQSCNDESSGTQILQNRVERRRVKWRMFGLQNDVVVLAWAQPLRH